MPENIFRDRQKRPPYKSISSSLGDLQARFHPLHWADLKKSGLNPSTIWGAEIFSVPPYRISELLGFDPPSVTSAMAFPYQGVDLVRLKIFPPQLDARGHKVKYLQPKGTGVHLFFPAQFKARLNQAEKLFIVEGEKKTLRADQEGLCAVGIGGIYGWTKKGGMGLIDDFSSVPLYGREIRVVPDGDFVTNRMVGRGLQELCAELISRGARVKVLDLNLAKAAS